MLCLRSGPGFFIPRLPAWLVYGAVAADPDFLRVGSLRTITGAVSINGVI